MVLKLRFSCKLCSFTICKPCCTTHTGRPYTNKANRSQKQAYLQVICTLSLCTDSTRFCRGDQWSPAEKLKNPRKSHTCEAQTLFPIKRFWGLSRPFPKRVLTGVRGGAPRIPAPRVLLAAPRASPRVLRVSCVLRNQTRSARS